MKILGYEISIKKSLQSVASGGWFPLVRESSPGAWQRSEKIEVDTALSHAAVFACVDLISKDIGKLPIRFTKKQAGYWAPIDHAHDALIKKPNHYQNRAQFVDAWIASKLLHGNTYALKQRRGSRIEALHILDPRQVEPLVDEQSGAVFYRLKTSHLAGVHEDVIVPAREIIHDRGLTPFHPLIGVSPLLAAGLAASSGLAILGNTADFFKNACNVSGLILAGDGLPAGKADEIKANFEAKYTGKNSGKVGVLAGGLKFQQLTMSAVDAQLLEQLNWSAQDVARAFHMPAWKIGCGNSAPYTSNEATNLSYYADCLQNLIEAFELCLDEGLNLAPDERTECDVDALLRMDTTTRYAAYTQAIGGGWMKPNEARAREGLPPVDGGDTCYMQQQNFALAALANRSTTEGNQK